MITVTLVGDKELIAKFTAMPRNVHDAVLSKVNYLAEKLKNHVVNDKLSGQVLNHVTGKLWRSIQQTVSDDTTSITGKVYSAGDVKYAAIHEYGGRTPPHVIEAKTGKALAFTMGGKQVFFKKVNHPGSVMPERSYMRSSLADMKEEITSSIKDAVLEGVKI